MSNIMELIDAYAGANTHARSLTGMMEARAAVQEAVEKLERDAARWNLYRSKAGPDAPNPFWCLRVIDGEVDRIADKAMKEATDGQGN